MRLARLAIISLTPPRKPALEPARFSGDGVEVHVTVPPSLASTGGPTRLVAKAFTAFPSPELDGDRFVVLPEEVRRRCEDAIMRAADIVAIATRSSRRIVTGTPPVAVIPEGDADKSLLAGAVAIRAGPPRPLSTVHSAVAVTDIAAAGSDRWDGVAILAEAYAHSLASGRYREFVRLFELAFAHPFTEMDKKLAQTLAPAMGYTAEEIRAWQALRHPFSHADGRRTRAIAVEADAQPVVQRMEQAALDILLNKAEWRKWSSSRRDVWKPTAMTTSPGGGGIILQHTPATAEMLVLDEFGVFPRALEIRHTGLPPEWFCRMVPAGNDG